MGPHQIYNVDEKGLTHTYAPSKILYRRLANCTEVGPPRGKLTTLIGCCNALGNRLPPYYIFAGERFNQNFLKDAPPGSAGAMTNNGWSTGDIFFYYLQNHFYKFASPSATNKLILIYDGHKTHVNVQCARWARDNNIQLFVIPAHTSHFIQPLDVSCFGPLERKFTDGKHRLMKGHQDGRL